MKDKDALQGSCHHNKKWDDIGTVPVAWASDMSSTLRACQDMYRTHVVHMLYPNDATVVLLPTYIPVQYHIVRVQDDDHNDETHLDDHYGRT